MERIDFHRGDESETRPFETEVEMATAVCTHVAEHLKNVKPKTKGCEECLKTGDSWSTCGCAWSVGMWAAATRRRTAMRGRIFTRRSIR